MFHFTNSLMVAFINPINIWIFRRCQYPSKNM